MKKTLYLMLSVILVLSFATIASAEPVDISLISPKDGGSINTFTQDFIYSFSSSPYMINCSVFVDDEIKGFRNVLIKTVNNKITIELESGEHEWYMICVDTDFNEIVSETRTLYVNTGESIIPEEGYDIIYNYNGLRSYIFILGTPQDPVELPAMLGGEDIQFKMEGKTYYIDIVKMGPHEDTSFVDIRNRDTGEKHQLLIGDTISFNFDDDKVVDAEITYKELERNVNAFFVVNPFPKKTVPDEEPEVEPEPEPEPEEETDDTNDDVTQEPDDEPVVIEEPDEEEEPDNVIIAEPEESGSNNTWLYILIVVIVIVVIVVLIISSAKRDRKPTAVKTEEEDLSGGEPPKESVEIVQSGGRKKKK